MKTLKLLGAALAAVTMTFTAQAEKTAKAVVEDGGTTLKFVYDEADYGAKDTDWFSVAEAEMINPDNEDVPWYGKMWSTVTNVVFAESFAAYQPTSVANWFYNFIKLTAVEGVAYWDTSKTTTFYALFANCSGLTTLDLAGLSTASAKNVGSMFQGCTALTTITATDSFAVPEAARSNNMFKNCTALVGGNGTPFDVDKTSGEYARIDKEGQPGYFTSPVAKVILSNDGKTLRFVYDGKDYGIKDTDWFSVAEAEAIFPKYQHVPWWYDCRKTVTNVVFDSSFAAYRPKQCGAWFCDFGVLAAVEGLTNLDTSVATDMTSMFSGCLALMTLDVTGFDTSNVTDMSYMFYGCSSLTTLDVTSFDTANVTTMGHMFYGCSSLTTLDVWGFDTSNVTSMSSMFYGCSSLTTLDVSGFDTAKVMLMNSMFYGCSSLTTLDVWGFDTANVTDMSYMFYGCSSLTMIIASDSFKSYNWSKIMFEDCTALKGGAGTAYDSAKVSSTYARIDGGPSAPGYFTRRDRIAKAVVAEGGKTLKFVYDDMSYGTKGTHWFSVAEAEAIDPYSEHVPWYGCREDVTKAVFDSSFADYRPTQCGRWFYCFESLSAIEGIGNLDTSAATSLAYMFCGCSSLTTLDVWGFDTANVTSMNSMFYGCSSLRRIYAGDQFVTDQVSYSSGMFQSCSKLVGGAGTAYDPAKTDKTYARIDKAGQPGYFTRATTAKVVVEDDGATLRFVYDNLDYGEKDTAWFSVAEAEAIDPSDPSDNVPWYDCRETVTKVVFDSSFAAYRPKQCGFWFYNFVVLAAVDGIGNLDTSAATSLAYMFSRCWALKSLDVSGFDTSNVTDMSSMFASCSSLTMLDVSGFNTANVTTMGAMFYYCSSLTSLDVSGFDTANVTSMNSMFYGCSSLEAICASDRFVTDQVSDSYRMFENCSKLVGGAGTAYDGIKTDKTYARIDKAGQPGFFSTKQIPPVAVYAAATKTLTFYCDGLDHSNEGVVYSVKASENIDENNSVPEWHDYNTGITNVVFDASFATYKPRSCRSWFYDFDCLKAINGIENLDTSEVVDMKEMFMQCSVLKTIDLSHFNTANVTNMNSMFSCCMVIETLDVSSFDTLKVRDMAEIFYNCWALTTIYAYDFSTVGVYGTDRGANMFTYSDRLVGGNGTRYSSDHVDYTYACIDLPATPGYFTYKEPPPPPQGSEDNPWTIGDDVQAYTNGVGGLIITGAGATSNYTDTAMVPWAEVVNEIETVEVSDAVKVIGDNLWAGLAEDVVINGETIMRRKEIAAGFPAEDPSGAISPTEFERIDIIDGKALLDVSVYTSDTLTNENWSVATNGVIEVPAPGKQGFFILKSKPAGK